MHVSMHYLLQQKLHWHRWPITARMEPRAVHRQLLLSGRCGPAMRTSRLARRSVSRNASFWELCRRAPGANFRLTRVSRLTLLGAGWIRGERWLESQAGRREVEPIPARRRLQKFDEPSRRLRKEKQYRPGQAAWRRSRDDRQMEVASSRVRRADGSEEPAPKGLTTDEVIILAYRWRTRPTPNDLFEKAQPSDAQAQPLGALSLSQTQ